MESGEEITFMEYSREYCVCVVDIVQSTLATAKMVSSKDIRKYYSIFINTISTIARNFDAKIIKNLGDSVIYYFPSTADSGNDTVFRNVLECFSILTAASPSIDEKLSECSLPPIQYRTSADYGKVEVARTKTSQDNDLFGSTVNLCVKINKLAAPGRILIGGDLFRLLKSIPSLTSDYDFRPAGEFSVGMKYSYPLYYINNKVSRPLIANFNQISDLRPTGAGILQKAKFSTDKLAKVMIVDDDRDILFTFKTILESHGISVDAYTKSIEAMNRFESHPHQYDLIILDIRMPILNGLQLYSMMTGIDRDIKILFVSALDASEELISLLPGINTENILKKPVESNLLISTVKKMTNGCR